MLLGLTHLGCVFLFCFFTILTSFKCKIQWHSVHSQSPATVSGIFHHSKEALYPSSCKPSFPNPLQSPSHTGSSFQRCVCSFFPGTHITEFLQYLFFCVWLISHSKMFSKFILQHAPEFHSFLRMNDTSL